MAQRLSVARGEGGARQALSCPRELATTHLGTSTLACAVGLRGTGGRPLLGGWACRAQQRSPAAGLKVRNSLKECGSASSAALVRPPQQHAGDQ